MSSRYEELFKTNEPLFYKNSPIVLEAYGLYKDLTDGRILCQIRFKNIGEDFIKACKIYIDEYEIDGTDMNVKTEFSFLDLNCGKNDAFGSKVPIYLSSLSTRRIKVRLNNIVLSNYDVVDLKQTIPEKIDKQINYIEHFGEEKCKIFNELVGNLAEFVPVKTSDYVLCTCGTINALNSEQCCKCGVSIKELINVSNDEYLQNELEKRNQKEIEEKKERERIEKEKEEKRIRKIKEREERERIEYEQEQARLEANKELRKRVLLFSTIFIIILLVLFNVIKYISKINKYNNALAKFDSGEYVESINDLSEIIGFKDSEKQRDLILSKYLELIIRDHNYEGLIMAIKNDNSGSENVANIYINKVKEFIDKNFNDLSLEEKYDNITKMPMNYIKIIGECKEIINSYIDSLIQKNEYEKAIDIAKKFLGITTIDPTEINYLEGKYELQRGNYLAAMYCFKKNLYYKDSNELYSKASDLNNASNKKAGNSKAEVPAVDNSITVEVPKIDNNVVVESKTKSFYDNHSGERRAVDGIINVLSNTQTLNTLISTNLGWDIKIYSYYDINSYMILNVIKVGNIITYTFASWDSVGNQVYNKGIDTLSFEAGDSVTDRQIKQLANIIKKESNATNDSIIEQILDEKLLSVDNSIATMIKNSRRKSL